MGPEKKNCKKVIEIIKMFYDYLNVPDNYFIKKKILRIEESKLLSLNINKAKNELNWLPTLSLNESINLTSDWVFKLSFRRTIRAGNRRSN